MKLILFFPISDAVPFVANRAGVGADNDWPLGAPEEMLTTHCIAHQIVMQQHAAAPTEAVECVPCISLILSLVASARLQWCLVERFEDWVTVEPRGAFNEALFPQLACQLLIAFAWLSSQGDRSSGEIIMRDPTLNSPTQCC